MDSRRMIYLVLAILIAIPNIQPLGIPVAIQKMTRDFYDTIESLPSGSVVILFLDVGMGMWVEVGPGTIAVTQHLLNRPLKLLISGQSPDMPAIWQRMLDFGNLDFRGKKYGEDYVVLGFYTGQETGAAAMAGNLHLTKADINRTPLDQIPMMKNLQTAKDVKAVITSMSGVEEEWYLRQWQGPYGTKVGMISSAVTVALEMTYYVSGQLFGIINSLRGGAEYELLIKKPADGLKGTDMLSMSHLWEIAVIAIGNILIVMEWRKRSQKKELEA